ncbi:hypothetical protein SAMN05421678_12125 [Actinopolymorpha cephalotaxi]|uniref:DNA primase n=1 Tax=Actinopolymorpha cephalotaxi TaxID=504797 RepID=A0A1I3AXW3_9ACTN|nr:hypothetical protein [Actinopolymorpha cephalotaxi]NYH84302.1 hypothetical protein [Actinopolymorpha cephalotaxi]SFH54800.1 hypothetical protein SAMN05421678_12125 [Actinopolymorpha cephalotaxi]
MNNSTKIALAVVGGYVLGRRKKARFALLLGSALIGKRLDLRALGQEAFERLSESPQFGRIKDEVTGELASTGRAAAMASLTRPLDRLADSLEERTAGLSGKPSGDGKGRGREDEDRDEAEEPEEDEEEESAEGRRGGRKAGTARGRGGEGRAGAKRTGEGRTGERRTGKGRTSEGRTGEGRRPASSRGGSSGSERGGRSSGKGERSGSGRPGGRSGGRSGSRSTSGGGSR